MVLIRKNDHFKKSVSRKNLWIPPCCYRRVLTIDLYWKFLKNLPRILFWELFFRHTFDLLCSLSQSIFWYMLWMPVIQLNWQCKPPQRQKKKAGASAIMNFFVAWAFVFKVSRNLKKFLDLFTWSVFLYGVYFLSDRENIFINQYYLLYLSCIFSLTLWSGFIPINGLHFASLRRLC